MEETLFQLLGEEQRIPHVCLCHWPSKFCRSSLLAVYLECPTLLEGMPPFALAANTVIVKSEKNEYNYKGYKNQLSGKTVSYRIQRLQGHLCVHFISLSISLNPK